MKDLHPSIVAMESLFIFTSFSTIAGCSQLFAAPNASRQVLQFRYMKNHGLMSIVLNVHPGVQLETQVDSRKCLCRSQKKVCVWGGGG